MKKYFLFVTHDGTAHLDERLALGALYIALEKEYGEFTWDVVRTREWRTKPAADKIFYIDVGGKYDGDSFFDHHQKGMEGECAATLVIKKMLPDLYLHPWFAGYLERVRIQDTRGLKQAAYEYGLEEAEPFLLEEFVENRRFEKDPISSILRMSEFVRHYVHETEDILECKKDLAPDFIRIVDTDYGKVVRCTVPTFRGYKKWHGAVPRLVLVSLALEHQAVAIVTIAEQDVGDIIHVFSRTAYGKVSGVNFKKRLTLKAPAKQTAAESVSGDILSLVKVPVGQEDLYIREVMAQSRY